MKISEKLKKINTRYFAEMQYPKYLDKLPIDEKSILLESQQGLGIDGNIWYIAKELLTNPNYSEYKIFISARNNTVEDKIKKLIANCCISNARATVVTTYSYDYYKHLASSKFLFNDNTFLSAFVKREGQVYVNTWHGTPLKTLGRRDKAHMHVLGNVQKNMFFADYIMCPNRFTYDTLVKDYMLENLCPATIILNGYPRNTALMNTNQAEYIRKKYKLEGKHVYAYMPTWRSRKKYILRDGVRVENDAPTFSDVTHAWLKKLDALLDEDELLFVKAHLREEARFEHHEYKHIRQWPEEEETYEFLNACECLVTDYSSVLFDYASTGRKCILFAYDYEQYVSTWGLHMKLEKLPFPIVRDATSLLRELRTGKNYDDELFLYDYCRYESEAATAKLLERTIQGNYVGTEYTVPNNGKKNILVYVGDLAPNGVTASLRGLLSNVDTGKYNYYLNFRGTKVGRNKSFLHELPREVKYISRIGKMPITFKQNLVMRLYNNKLISFKRYWKVMKPAYEIDIRRQLGNNKFDVAVQFTGYEYKRLLMYSLLADKSIVYVHSDMLAEKKTRDNQDLKVLNYAYNNYDKIVAVSEGVVEPTRKLAGSDIDINVIYNLIDTDSIIKAGNYDYAFTENTKTTASLDEINSILDGSSNVYISVGRFSPEKGHDRLVRAFDRYWKNHTNDYLIIQGGSQTNDGYNKLLKQVNEMEARDHIILMMRPENPFALVKRCDGLILSSYYEGFGLVLVEGDILGVPVVSVDIEGPRKFMIENGGTLVENSEDGLVDAFNLLNDGKVPLLHADYHAMNCENAEKFEALL